MYQVKVNTDVYLPIRFYDTVTNAPTTGVLYTTISMELEYSDGTTANVTILSPSWTEIVVGAFAGSGNYTYKLGFAQNNKVGRLRYAVSNSSPATTAVYSGVIDVVANLVSDVLTSKNVNYLGVFNSTTGPTGVVLKLTDTNGNPMTGTVSSPTITVSQPGGSVGTLTPTLTEITTGAASGKGLYQCSALTGGSIGPFTFVLTSSSISTYYGEYFCVTNFDTSSLIGTPTGGNLTSMLNTLIGTPVTNVSGDIAAVKSDTGSILTDVTGIQSVLGTPAFLHTIAGDITTIRTSVGSNLGTNVSSIITLIGTPTVGATLALSDTALYNRIGAPAGASVSADIAAVKTDTSSLIVVSVGKWTIFKTGPDANRLILYELDGVTVHKKFDLKDDTGAPSTTTVYERDPL